jgi:hypothetical protein
MDVTNDLDIVVAIQFGDASDDVLIRIGYRGGQNA